MVAEGMAGATDPSLLHPDRSEHRILLTMDKSIADVRAYPPADYAGIILLRPRLTERAAGGTRFSLHPKRRPKQPRPFITFGSGRRSHSAGRLSPLAPRRTAGLSVGE